MSSGGDRILLAHGGGGQLSRDLIDQLLLPAFGNDILNELSDAATVPIDGPAVCFTTDSYVIKPLFFNGGDIGKLAVCGTVNDLAVAGARPIALTVSLIIEEGLEFQVLEKVVASISAAAASAGVKVVAGDTKTVEAGNADRLFINTAGIGQKLPGARLGTSMIESGDRIVLSGTIGDHGLAIMSQRDNIAFESELVSDCAALSGLIERLIGEFGKDIKFMRDPTRGGVAAVANEIAASCGHDMELRESAIPVRPTVRAAAEILGLDILNVANEGKFLAVVSPARADEFVELCRSDPLGSRAGVVGIVGQRSGHGLVEIRTAIGGSRIVPMPYGRDLPRIC